MAGAAPTTSVVLYRPSPAFPSSPPFSKARPFRPLSAHWRRRRFTRLQCEPHSAAEQVDSSSEEEQKVLGDSQCPTESPPSKVDATMFPDKSTNRRIALASTLGAIGLFLSSRLDFGESSKDLNANVVFYEEALSNGKPTVVEFYADWCEVCREIAPDVNKVKQQYRNRVNFVMLNVDNTKWEQELDEFGVEGIPHFAFLDKDGNEEGNVVGRLPTKYLLENVAALANGESSIPYARAVGQYSSAEGRKAHRVIDPRSHG